MNKTIVFCLFFFCLLFHFGISNYCNQIAAHHSYCSRQIWSNRRCCSRRRRVKREVLWARTNKCPIGHRRARNRKGVYYCRKVSLNRILLLYVNLIYFDR